MKAERITSAYISLMLTVFILFTGTGGYYWLARKKFIIWAALTLVWALALTVCVAKERPLMDKRDPLLRIAALYGVLCIVSTVVSDYPVFAGFDTGRYNGLAAFLLYGLLFLGVYFSGRLKEHHLLLFFGAASLCSAMVLLQYAGLNPLSLYPDGMNFYSPYIQQVFRFMGTVGNVDLLSALNCLAVPAAVCSFTHISPKLRFIPLISAILGLGSAFAASVSSGFIALASTLAVYLPVKLWGGGKEKKLRQFVPLVFLCAETMACFASVLVLPDEAGSSRILIWKSSLAVFKEHPLLGIGPDSLSHYSGIVFNRYSPELGRELTAAVDNAHCELIHHMVSFGLAGLVPIGTLTVRIYKRAAEHFLAPALFCYLVQSFFNLGLPVVTPVFVILLALCVGEDSSI